MPRIQSITATIIKEWALLRRDVGGMLVMLVMPAALIVIMALVQDAPFRDYQDLHLEVLIADEDGGALAAAVKETLIRSKAFTLLPMPNVASMREDLRKGKHTIGLIIPKGATAEVVNAANTVANTFATQMGGNLLPQRPPRDSLAIMLVFDPVSRPAFRMAILAALDKAVSGASTKLLLQRLGRLSGNRDTTGPQKPDMQQVLSGLGIREARAASRDDVPLHINSTQHNVPAWAIFGMFFIVVPLSGHIIRERVEGSALRVRLIPGAAACVAIGRIVANTIMCSLQFCIMCAVGRWLLPLTGLPALTLGAHPAAIIPIVLATALCATAYGNMVGMLFKSATQALSFGAISIVILSALGGIWVPVELLPPVLKTFAKISPLHWGLQGVQSVILRDGTWREALPSTLVLAGLAACMYAIALWREQAGYRRL